MSDTSEGPGQVLRAEREALGVTTRDVAETLNLAVTMVEAIEADDYEQMPASVFARGYIRAYARLLSLEPEPLVARYPEDAGVVDGNGATRTSAVELLRQNARLVASAGGLLLLLLLVLLAVWLWPDSESAIGPASEPEAEAPATLPEAVEAGATAGAAAGAAANTVADTGEQSGPVDDPAGALRPPSAATEATRDVDAPSSQRSQDSLTRSAPGIDLRVEGAAEAPSAELTARTDSATEPAVDSRADPPGVRRITEFGRDLLRFDFSEDCWVDVKSATGRRLYGDLNLAGGTLSLVGEGPFRILLGYAPGVQLSLNGEPISLAPHTRNNVATLVVGQ